MSELRWIYITDPITGEKARVEPNGGLAVNVQDQTTLPIEYFLTQKLNPVVITAPAAAKTKILQLQAGHGVLVGEFLEIYAETPDTPVPGNLLKSYQQLAVIGVNVNTITVQPFIEFDMIPANILLSTRATASMQVDGSVTPQAFYIGPPNGLKWDLTRTMITMVVATNPDDGLYGNLTLLPNGVFFGVESDLGQNYLVNIKTNAGYRSSAYDVTYTTRASGGGNYGVSIRKSFAGQDKYGVAVRLEGETNDHFVTYVNDDLRGITEHRQVIMGHVVED